MSTAVNGLAAKRLRVAVLNRNFAPTGGGAERYSIALVEQLAARHDIHVFAQVIEHQWPGVTYHLIPTPLRKPRWINQLWFATATWWATRSTFDVVHSHENTWHGNVQTAHVLPVKHNLFSEHSGLRLALQWIKVVTSPRLIAYLVLERMRFKQQSGRCIVATSNTLQVVLSVTYPGCQGAVSTITPGITMPKLPVTDIQKIAARKLLGLPTTGFCLLMVANDYHKKGLETLLQALSLLSVDTILVVVGNPSHILEFRAQAISLKLGTRVFFIGPLSDVGVAYQAADCLAHPTLEDTFAMVVLEAMAYGLPVLVSGSKYCGVAELLQHRINAMILNDPKDVEGMIHILEQISSDLKLKKQLESGAIDFALCYQWSDIAVKQEAIYYSI